MGNSLLRKASSKEQKLKTEVPSVLFYNNHICYWSYVPITIYLRWKYHSSIELDFCGQSYMLSSTILTSRRALAKKIQFYTTTTEVTPSASWTTPRQPTTWCWCLQGYSLFFLQPGLLKIDLFVKVARPSGLEPVHD